MLHKIASQFRKPSGFWGKVVSEFMVKGNKPHYITLINDWQLPAQCSILEIGYGPGTGIKMLANTFSNCQIYGIDFSELMFHKATKLNKKWIAEKRVFLQFGDFIDSTINTGGFNKIFCINVIYFWNDLQPPFAKIHQLLAPKGEFCFYMAKREDLNKLKFTVDDVFNKYSIEQVIVALKTAGFAKTIYTYKNGYFITAQK